MVCGATFLELFGQLISAKNCRSFSWPQPPRLSIGWMYHYSWPMLNCWQTPMICLGIAGGTSCLAPSEVPIGGQVYMQTYLIASGIAQSANRINRPYCPKKSYVGWTKVVRNLLDGASTWQDHFHKTKMEIVIFCQRGSILQVGGNPCHVLTA